MNVAVRKRDNDILQILLLDGDGDSKKEQYIQLIFINGNVRWVEI